MTKWWFSILIGLGTLLLTATSAQAVSSLATSVDSPSGFFHSLTPSLSLLTSGFDGDDAENFSPRFGFGVNALVEGGHGPLYLETGLTYREGGGTLREFYRGHELSDEILLKYLDMPASAKYYIRLLSRSMIYAKAGAKASVLLSRGESGLDSSYAVVTNDEGAPLVDNFSPISFEGLFALGGRVELSHDTALNFELSYSQGLWPIQSDESFYNYTIAFTTGVEVSLL
jgi:hypothetical protein